MIDVEVSTILIQMMCECSELASNLRSSNFYSSNFSNAFRYSEKTRRAIEKKEQFRQVKAHVPKDDGRLRAYGWSLPVKNAQPQLPPPPSNSSHVPVPVIVFCRPLMEYEPGMKVKFALNLMLLSFSLIYMKGVDLCFFKCVQLFISQITVSFLFFYSCGVQLV